MLNYSRNQKPRCLARPTLTSVIQLMIVVEFLVRRLIIAELDLAELRLVRTRVAKGNNSKLVKLIRFSRRFCFKGVRHIPP